MNVEATKVNSANGKVKATISSQKIDAKETDLAKKYAKNMKVDGFRKGKIPAHVVKARYGQQLVGDAKNELVQEVISMGVKQLGETEVLGNPHFTKFEETEHGLEVEFSVALRPEIPLNDYHTLVPDFEVENVDDEAVIKAIEEAALASATATPLKRKRALKTGDIAVFDFEGEMDGKVVDNASAKNFSLEIGSGQFIPGFEDGMIGMKYDEQKDITLTFPESYHAKEMAGKEVVFHVELKEIQEKVLPELNDELAQKLLPNEKEATLEKLKALIKKSLESEKTSKLYNETLKPKLLEMLVNAVEFDLPEAIVEEEVVQLANAKLQGLSADERKEVTSSEEKTNALKEEQREEAKARVKTTLVVDHLAKKESISITDQEVQQTIYYEAYTQQQDPKTVYEYYQKEGFLPVIKMSMLEDRILSHLLNTKLKQEA